MAYSQEDKNIIINKVLSTIETGLSLRKAILELNIVSRDTFNEWLKEDKEISDQYARACEKRADAIFEEILDIADETSRDTIITDKGEFPNGEWMQRSRLRVDARKWMLGKMNPKKYGDKVQNEHSGEITTNIISLGNGTPPEAK